MDYLYIFILTLLQICLLIQMYYTIVFHQKLAAYKVSESDEWVKNPVSVVICARNEIDNLKKNLDSFLEQDHPDFEVIVVNDCSNDGSGWYLKDKAKEHQHLKVVTIDEHPRFKHGKKFAVTLGIKAAKNENLVFSDADCRPASPSWLSRMQAGFDDSTEIILGYSPYERRGGLLNTLIRFETCLVALNYISFALVGKPYMGVGRNMAYKKSLFFRGKGFAAHMHVLSGDDDLFVNQNATAANTSIEIHPDAHVWSDPKKTFFSYYRQKVRHMGAGKLYKRQHKNILTIQAVSGLLFYASLIALILLKAQWWLLLSVYLLRLIVQLFVYIPCFRKLRSRDLLWWLPLLDIIYYFYTMILNFVSLFKKGVEWK